MVGVASEIYGPALYVTEDGARWRQLVPGPVYDAGGPSRLRQVWTLREDRGSIYAGVQDAGLFRSEDQGESWKPISGVNEHPTRGAWAPGAGGLCLHEVLFDARTPRRLWCGISAVGVLRSDDGGESWTPKNEGVSMALEDETHKEIGRCVHGLVQDPLDSNRIYRQDHSGMYMSKDGGDLWIKNERGLPSGFGFPIALDPSSGSIFAAPQESDQRRIPLGGALGIYRSADRGVSWSSASAGLPKRHAYGTVLRGAMAVDGLDPGGVYIGTTSGTLHASRNSGDSWRNLDVALARVLHVSAWPEP